MVIRALQTLSVRISYFGNLICDILSFSENFSSISFVWSRRTGNMLTHKLALFDLSCSRPFFSMIIHVTLVDTILADLGPIFDL